MTLTLTTEGSHTIRRRDLVPERRHGYRYAEVPGLCLTEWPPVPGDPHPRYSITHFQSGARVGQWLYVTREQAEAALLRVQGFFDWTQAIDVLRAEFELRSLIDAALVERFTAALLPGAVQ